MLGKQDTEHPALRMLTFWWRRWTTVTKDLVQWHLGDNLYLPRSLWVLWRPLGLHISGKIYLCQNILNWSRHKISISLVYGSYTIGSFECHYYKGSVQLNQHNIICMRKTLENLFIYYLTGSSFWLKGLSLSILPQVPEFLTGCSKALYAFI